jgi:hypothetical protein
MKNPSVRLIKEQGVTNEKEDPLSLKTSFKDGILQVHLNKLKI